MHIRIFKLELSTTTLSDKVNIAELDAAILYNFLRLFDLGKPFQRVAPLQLKECLKQSALEKILVLLCLLALL